MKKLILLGSFGLLGTFAMAGKNVENNNKLEKVKMNIDLQGYCCTATVWHYGEPVASYTICGTSNNCGLAQALAEAYICANGGPCF